MSTGTRFAFWFVAIFFVTYGFLAAVDALPEPVRSDDASNGSGPAIENPEQPEAPVRIVARTIGMDNNVLNPESTDAALLDEALLHGTIRYPTSALLGEDGTVALFGHSSYLPIVRNQNYKAFNGIQKLKVGDTVSAYSETTEYRYTVTEVVEADASDAVVPLRNDGKFLVLVTCDSFGQKSDRFVVYASLEGTYALH